jgi:hypothetical protein
MPAPLSMLTAEGLSSSDNTTYTSYFSCLSLPLGLLPVLFQLPRNVQEEGGGRDYYTQHFVLKYTCSGNFVLFTQNKELFMCFTQNVHHKESIKYLNYYMLFEH